MIHASRRTSLRKKRQSSNDNSAKNIQHEAAIPTVTKHPAFIRYSNLYKQEKAQIEIAEMFRTKKSYPIAPDGSIPNSSFRTVFKTKEIKPVEVKVLKDILDKPQKEDMKNLSCQHNDDELEELIDPNAVLKSASTKKSKGTLVSHQKVQDDLLSEDMMHNKYWNKDAIPDLFKRMQNELWWKQTKDEKPNLRSMLVYLKDIVKLKQIDSYESACSYVIEIFRTYGLEPIFVNQILDILLNYLLRNENDPLDICTIRTIAQFMIERKDLIIRLLEYALEYEPSDTFRQEVVNAIKFITDVNNSDEIDLVLDNISVVHDYPDDSFSLKMIIKSIENKTKISTAEIINGGEENDGIHPLLLKISQERWFPRRHVLITLDYVLDAIIVKLLNTTKTLVKTLTTHLVQLHHVIGYSTEQFDRVSNTLISLLSHTEADYRLIAATNLANLRKETKAIDIALLNSFMNDSRILVRTECCDSLKILTGILSDTVLKDCADDMLYLQTLPDEDFSLQNYLKEKNPLPTSSSLPIEGKVDEEKHISTNEIEQNLRTNQTDKNENITTLICHHPPSSQIMEHSSIINNRSPPTQLESNQFSHTPSLISSMAAVQPPVPVQVNENRNSSTPHMPKFRQKKQSTSSTKTSISVHINKIRPLHLPDTWDSNINQNKNIEEEEIDESQFNFDSPSQATFLNDSFRTIIEEHKQTIGFYRMIPNRRILIPHKITMDNILSDQSHIIINQHLSQPYSNNQNSFKSPLCSTNPMRLSDLNHNQHCLHEIESIQLLSSLVIRAMQIHRQHDKCIPGSCAANFPNMLNISPMQLNSSSKLPPIEHQRPTSRQYAHIRSNVRAKARKEGINIKKAQNMQGALSNLLKTNQEQSTSNPSNSRQTDVTHAWLLVHLLKSQGIFYPENYLQKIIQFYPKFLPLLHTKIPQHLIRIIWNDPSMKQIVSIFSNKQNELTVDNSSIKRSDTRPSIPITDDEHSLNSFDYISLIHRDDQKKKFLPPIRNSKMSSPRPVYVNLMMSEKDNMVSRHESVKNRSRQMLKNDYPTASFLPIVTRVPMCC